MKMITLTVWATSPIIIGFLYQNLSTIPGLGQLLSYFLPLVMLVYWFVVGTKCAEMVNHFWLALLGVNSLGLVSLLVYFWQFELVAETGRDAFWVNLSQYFSVAVAPLIVNFAQIFRPMTASLSQTGLTLLEVAECLAMLLIFGAGYSVGRRITDQ